MPSVDEELAALRARSITKNNASKLKAAGGALSTPEKEANNLRVSTQKTRLSTYSKEAVQALNAGTKAVDKQFDFEAQKAAKKKEDIQKQREAAQINYAGTKAVDKQLDFEVQKAAKKKEDLQKQREAAEGNHAGSKAVDKKLDFEAQQAAQKKEELQKQREAAEGNHAGSKAIDKQLDFEVQKMAQKKEDLQKQKEATEMNHVGIKVNPKDTPENEEEKKTEEDAGLQLSVYDVLAQKDKDGKKLEKVSAFQFLVVAGVIAPTVATLVLPMSIVYQIGKAAVSALLPRKTALPWEIDSGVSVAPNEIIPHSDRKYDIVLLGATGFTGRLVAMHLAKTYGTNEKVKWAIAGRNQKKLDQVKDELASDLGMDGILKIETIIVDTGVASTLPALVRDTRVVVTTAGPFMLHGNLLVEFCAKFGTHYADITGEIDWAKKMMVRWQDTAKKTGAKIVPCCGCDCIPWDITTYDLANKLKKEKNEDLAKIEFFNEFNGGVSGGTMATASLFMQGKAPSPPNEDPMRNNASGNAHNNRATLTGPFSISSYIAPWSNKRIYGSFSVLAPSNFGIVAWTQALREGAPLCYSEVAVVPDLKTGLAGIFGFASAIISLLNPITRYLMHKFILPKQGEGPSMKAMTNEYFFSAFAKGIGTNGSQAEAVIYYPRCAGYLDTGRMLAESGLALALESESLPVKTGGFYSPAYALGDVLLKRLKKTGTYYASAIKD